MIRWLYCLLFVVAASYGFAQSSRFEGGGTYSKVPAKIVGPYFQVKGKVNGKEVTLIVDSGAGLSVITNQAAKRLGIEGGMKMQAGGAGGKSVPATLVTIDSFQVGEAIVEKERTIVLDLPEVLQCDGLVGYSFLKHFATTFDYADSSLTFATSGTHVPTSDEQTTELKIIGNIPYLSGSLDGINGQFSIDTGAGGVLAVSSPFVTENQLKDKYPQRVSRIIGKGVGGFVMGDRVTLKQIILAGFEFKNVPGAFANEGSGALSKQGNIGNVGADLIRRLILTFDYPAQKAYLKKSPQFDSPYEVDRSGLFCDYEGGIWKVANVVPGSPASKAGIKEGDQVLIVDGIDYKSVHPLNFGRSLRQPAGTVISVELRRGSKDIVVRLVLGNG